MKWQQWGIAVVPLAAGLVVAALMTSVATVSNPVLTVRVDLGTLAVLAGLSLSALATMG